MPEKTHLKWLGHVFREEETGRWLVDNPEHANLLQDAQSLIDREAWTTRPPEEVAEAVLKWRPAQAEASSSVALWMLMKFSGRFDVLRAALDRDVWRLVHTLQPIMSSLDFTPEQLALLIERLAEQTRGDLAAGIALQPFEEWARQNPALAMEVIRRRPHLLPDAALSLTVHAVRGVLAEEDRATTMAWSDPARAEHGILLGTLPELVVQSMVTREAALDLIEAALFDEWAVANLAWHGFRQLLEVEVGETDLSLFVRLIDDPRPEIRLVLARFLAGTADEQLFGYATRLLLNAFETDSAHLGVIQALDLLLAQLSDSQPEFVEDYLTQWADRHARDTVEELLTKTFKITYHHVSSRQPEYWGQVAGKWLLNRPILFRVASQLLHDHHTDFHTLVPLSDEQFAALTERILCTDVGGAAQLKLLGELEPAATSAARTTALQEACSEIVTNFPGASLNFEKDHAASNPVMVTALRARRELYLHPREGRTALLEFAPPVERLRKWHAHAQRAQREVSRRVEEEGDFVFTKLARKVSVGRGDAWSITQHDGTFGPVQPFSSFSYEQELPRLEILEPENAMRRRIERLQRTDLGSSE